ncbi:MAG: Rieske (2Fe-2S) protein [Actinomycetota bacterium]|nr:Rieske (2Fe-2S) protein [Actinomycetota bacterium]
MAAKTETGAFVRAASLENLRQRGRLAVRVGGHSLALFFEGGKVYAVDNRCPHMGFPLDRGTVNDSILTCHWHHARFDLESGGTFDQFADDARVFPAEIRDGDVWVDLTPRGDWQEYRRGRLRDGLERNISLVMAKSVIALLDGGEDPAGPFRDGLLFGVRYRREGWGQGLTMHTCMMNLLPHLIPEDRPRALYHGLSAVARDSDGAPPRFILSPLPDTTADVPTLKRWFRRFVEVRDAEGAERCIVSAVRAGADPGALADMLFTAATDHRYIDIGHPVDFTNKAFEALDIAGWEHAEPVLASLVSGYANATRMEESNSWRNPIDLVAILERAFEEVPRALESGRERRGGWMGREELAPMLLGEDPQAIADALLEALREGAAEAELAGAVAYAAALRIARFHTSNEFGDWDTALHTFTFANAVQGGLRRVETPRHAETPHRGISTLVRGVFDAAMSVYLDRFLNVPPARLPEPAGEEQRPEELLEELPVLLDRQQRVNEVGDTVARYLYSGGDPRSLLSTLGGLLLREDRDFHTIQAVEAAFRHVGTPRRGISTTPNGAREGVHVLVAAARYLAAHAPTVRSQGQTYTIARRLARGERIHEEV